MAVLKTDLQAASRLAQAGRFAEAVALYRGVLAGAPDDAEAVHFLGVCLVRSGQRDEGMPLVKRSVSLAPANTLYRQNFGLLLAEAGELAAAEQSFQQLIALEKENPTAHNYLGMVRQRLGRLDEAVASYDEALRLRPGDAAAANNLGYCLLERGELERATSQPREPRARVEGLEVRQARQRIFALPADDPARKVTTLRDFYSASGARDLVLHVQEHRFTVPQLASAIAELCVEFLGFELTGRRNPMSLAQWDAYETANPDTFASMYQFWIRKP